MVFCDFLGFLGLTTFEGNSVGLPLDLSIVGLATIYKIYVLFF